MSDENIRAHRTLLYGPQGIGKTFWASYAPDVLFLAPEDGMQELDPPKPKCICISTENAIQFVEEFPEDKKTMVIDTCDALVEIFADGICVAEGWDSVMDPGYGKGTAKVKKSLREFLKAIELLQIIRPEVEVIFLGHSEIKNFVNPRGLDYCKYQLKMYPTCAELLKDWCDNVLFACYEETGAKESGKKTAKGTGTSEPVVYTRHRPAWDAKNRRQLDFKIPLKYEVFNRFKKPIGTSKKSNGITVKELNHAGLMVWNDSSKEDVEPMLEDLMPTLDDVKKALRARFESKKSDGWTMDTMKEKYFKPLGITDLNFASSDSLGKIVELIGVDIQDEKV